MKYTIFTITYLFFFLNHNISHAQTQHPIGTNIVGVVDWSEEFVFVDVMKQSRKWITHDAAPGSDWSSGVEIPLGTNGYPLEIPYDNGIDPPQGIRTVMYSGPNLGIYPSGNYRLVAEGTGQIRLRFATNGIFQCPVDTLVFMDSALGFVALEILLSQVTDPIHNIRFIMPGYENVSETDPFYPPLLEFLEDFEAIRFMDWMKTNNSEVEEWADRNTVGNYSQTLKSGVAYEYMIELSNLLQKDLWVNIPHRASDDFIIQFARLLRDNVDANLKIYVEYSNEVWNGSFLQNQYAADEGLALGYGGQPWERSWKYTAKRSADIFQIFENEFTDDSRFIKVIPSQAASPWVTNYILERFNETLYNPTQISADVIAIAPYFGGEVAKKIGDAGLASTITVEAILDSMELSLPKAFERMDGTKIVADNYGLDMIAYEGGQHLVAYYPYNEDPDYVAKLLDANRHPRMEDMYCTYFDYWYNAGGGMFAHFSSHGNYSKWGAWGVKETYEDVNSPKYLALQNCVFDQTTTSNANVTLTSDAIQLLPNPTDGLFRIVGTLADYTIEVLDVNGNIHQTINNASSSVTININTMPTGLYFIRISNQTNGAVSVEKIIKMN